MIPSTSTHTIKTTATITCPICHSRHVEEMPRDACQHFYKCKSCKTLIKPKQGDCCVFCSYSDSLCPPKQVERFTSKNL